MKLRVLVACEESGTVRDAFRALGTDSWSCDLQPPTGNATYHIQGDALEQLDKGWDLLIAHPPCTYLANSGVSWLFPKDGTLNRERFDDIYKGGLFFNKFLNAPIPFICVENPIMHKHAKEIVSTPYTQKIQPHQFGLGESKATCLWLKGLPKLKPTSHFCGAEQRLHKLPPSATRAKERSKTYKGIAEAMAKQWSEWIIFWKKQKS